MTRCAYRSVNISSAGCKESSATLSLSDACSLSTSDCYEASTRNDIDADLSRVSCNMDERRSDVSRSPPSLGIPDVVEDHEDEEDESCTRVGRAACFSAATCSVVDATPSSFSSATLPSFSIWNILQATTQSSSKREQSCPGYKAAQQANIQQEQSSPSYKTSGPSNRGCSTTLQLSFDYKTTLQQLNSGYKIPQQMEIDILDATSRSKREHSSPDYKTPQQAALSLYAGDGFSACRQTGRRQLLMQAAVISQPLGFQVERLATSPPSITAATAI